MAKSKNTKSTAKKPASSLRKVVQAAKSKPAPASKTQQSTGTDLVVRSVSLTSTADGALAKLVADLSGQLGRRVSSSAVVRALLERCARDARLERSVATAIAAELRGGAVVWGRQR